ncbi:MAG TPA: hypothetical protein VHS78_06365 [Candidatus Elarobacter sp.]|nr:hypothetical protein [Candidatus Elarobacter sp.]
MLRFVAASCVCVTPPQAAPWIGPVMGALVGAAIAAVVAFVTKGMDYGRHDRSVRTQLVALLRLAAMQFASTRTLAPHAEASITVGTLARLVDRVFSSDVAMALKIAEAQVVYDAIRDAEAAARQLETALSNLKVARAAVLQDLPAGESRGPVMERRMNDITEREKVVGDASAAGVAALNRARHALGNSDPLPSYDSARP